MPRDNAEVFLTPSAQRAELASIFAAGILRLRKRRRVTGLPAETREESPAKNLDVRGETVLSVDTG